MLYSFDIGLFMWFFVCVLAGLGAGYFDSFARLFVVTRARVSRALYLFYVYCYVLQLFVGIC